VSANPRQAAFQTLLRIEKERSYADLLVDRELSSGRLHGPDRGLFTELVYGVLRKQGNLDHVLGQFSRIAVAKLERAVLLLLRLGLYQLLHLDRVPAAAAVNETVTLARQFAPRSAGFVNAVLRNADRGRDRISYPDPDRSPAAYLAARYSHPRWLAAAWLDQLGPAEAEQLSAAMAEPPPLTIRVNTLRTGRTELAARLTGAGARVEQCRYAPQGLVITHTHGPPTELPGFQAGEWLFQDESSQLAALFMAPQPGERLLDLCAAPGGKATYLAQLQAGSGSILACDRDERKLRFIRENAGRLGLPGITTAVVDATGSLAALPGPFDRVLVDAPCSGLGVLRRHPEGKWWKQPADVARLAETQASILANAARVVAPGGVILYATCSTSTDENEAVIEDFLSHHQGFMIEDLRIIHPEWQELFTPQGFFRSWPHRHGMDGFFAARLLKSNG
jgi:16S rRNA (cytosine967-C5)-methyltransferase